jgi:nicotinate-nucleotide adenylyltransferase
MRIAFFGGSFDPPHLGHLAIARAARQALQLDLVLFAPVGLQPHKPSGSTASFEHRVAMTRLAIASEPAFELSLIEAPNPARPAPNFTVDTLTRLRQSLPLNTELFLLLGADSFRNFPQWHRAAEIPFLASLIVASRPNENLSNLSDCLPPGITLSPLPTQPHSYLLHNAAGDRAQLTLLPNLHYDISATQLRNQINEPSINQPANEPPLLSPTVLSYIHQHHLYK